MQILFLPPFPFLIHTDWKLKVEAEYREEFRFQPYGSNRQKYLANPRPQSYHIIFLETSIYLLFGFLKPTQLRTCFICSRSKTTKAMEEYVKEARNLSRICHQYH